jgi:YD repeat-containing protein
VTSAGAPAGTVGFTYDDRGLLTATTGPAQYVSSFVYDAGGRMVSRADAAGTSTFFWTLRDQLASVSNPLTGTSQTNTFDAAGQLTSVGYGPGVSRTLGYDQLGRVTSDQLRNAANVVTASYAYCYDVDGKVTSMTANLPGNPSAGANSPPTRCPPPSR